DLSSSFVGDSLALDEPSLETGGLHRPSDRFAPTVNHYRINFDGLEKDNVPGDSFPHRRVWRIHETAAVLDDDSGAIEPLYLGQGRQRVTWFCNQIPHDARFVRLVSEMSYRGKGHRQVLLVGGGDNLPITHRTARLNRSSSTGFGGRNETVSKRKEGVATH